MNFNEFKSLIAQNLEKTFQIILPTGNIVPVSFHITEISVLNKKFLDCGGTLRELKTCQLQVWLGSDEEHRLNAKKLLSIIKKAEQVLELTNDLPVEIEYEDQLISQFTIVSHQATEEAVVLTLANKHTDCLAKEVCGVAVSTDASSVTSNKDSNKCDCGPGKC